MPTNALPQPRTRWDLNSDYSDRLLASMIAGNLIGNTCSKPFILRRGLITRYQRMRLKLSWASHFLSGALVIPIGALFAFSIGVPLEDANTCSGRPAAAEIFEGITPHLRPEKATEAELAMAEWGIGGEDFWLRDGKVWPGDYRSHISDGRTAVAVDLPRKLLFLAIGTHISPTLMFQTLADLGAKDGMLLDGGDSSSMAIGTGARGVSPGTGYGWRPVANQFGVRAEPLQ